MPFEQKESRQADTPGQFGGRNLRLSPSPAVAGSVAGNIAAQPNFKNDFLCYFTDKIFIIP